MSEELNEWKEFKGDYQCDECGSTFHDPVSEVCPSCQGQLVYMMTDADEVKALRAELAAEKEKHRWIPVSERLPGYDQTVLVADDEGVDFGWIVERYGWNTSCGMIEGKITHWMPIHENPEGDK